MRGDDSAYAALGLRPGATRAHVDDAYRRLIKVHHPDRNGGDGRRAAEINRAYTLLRRDLPAAPVYRSVPMPVRTARRRRGSSRPFWLLVVVAGVGIGALAAQDSRRTPAVPYQGDWQPAAAAQSSAPLLGRFDEPLHANVVDASIRSAVQFHADGDAAGAAEYSRDCHHRLRENPNLALFDACAAFDESTITLHIANPAETGQFNGSAALGRQLAAARTISDDMLGADSRLHQIRSRVELALLPRLDEAASRPAP